MTPLSVAAVGLPARCILQVSRVVQQSLESCSFRMSNCRTQYTPVDSIAPVEMPTASSLSVR